jgi:hypothetical protein
MCATTLSKEGPPLRVTDCTDVLPVKISGTPEERATQLTEAIRKAKSDLSGMLEEQYASNPNFNIVKIDSCNVVPAPSKS